MRAPPKQTQIEVAIDAHHNCRGNSVEKMKAALEAAEQECWQPIETVTLNKPFSADPKDLIICNSEQQIRKIQEAFKHDAFYCTWHYPLMGHRFERIIIFMPTTESEAEMKRIQDMINIFLPTKLRPNGKIIVLE